jgi:uncharacterized protein YjbI with pentapeptide repeats
MRARATARVLLISMTLCACGAFSAPADRQTNWTWKDGKGNLRSRADLDEILKQHARWLQSNRQSGSMANLSFADLRGADLRSAHLSGADLIDSVLSDANLSRADLSGAVLRDAKLSRTILSYANLSFAFIDSAVLSGAHLSGADLRSANLGHADLSDANLGDADLSDADLRSANLSRAYLRDADLRRANLGYADLSGAILGGAILSYADLNEADLSGANLAGTLVAGINFQPKSLPTANGISRGRELWLMTYSENPGPLSQLRKQFQDAGYHAQEREITYALNRHDADPSAMRAYVEEKWKSIRGEPFKRGKILPLRSIIESAFKWFAFDLTCQYGMSYGRPLRIVGVAWLLFTLVYTVFIHLPGKSGLYFVGTRVWRGKSNTQGIQIRPEPLPAAKWWKVPFLWLRREWRVLRGAMFFSLMSAFNIGFRDINFGRWLRLLTKSEYDLKAVGWARTASGIQSLLSVYLIALWVLTYFGRPFG